MRLNTTKYYWDVVKYSTVCKSNKIQEHTWKYIEIYVFIFHIILYVNVFHCILLYFRCIHHFCIGLPAGLCGLLGCPGHSLYRKYACLAGIHLLCPLSNTPAVLACILPVTQSSVGPMEGQTEWSISMNFISFSNYFVVFYCMFMLFIAFYKHSVVFSWCSLE